MDPVSLTTAAVTLIGACAAITQFIKSIIQKIKGIKPLLVQLLDKVEHVRLYLASLRSLAARLTSPVQKSLIIPYDTSPCELTIDSVKSLVESIGRAAEAGKLKMVVAWTQERKAIETLVAELDAHEKRIMQALIAISAVSSVITNEAVEKLIADKEEAAGFGNPFEEPSEAISDAKATAKGETPVQAPPVYTVLAKPRMGHRAGDQMWPVKVTSDEMPREYMEAREQLADSAYMGHWDLVIESIETGHKLFGESWINAPRMKHLEERQWASLWTPLHQAAFYGADLHVVETMIGMGASRTLRSRRGGNTLGNHSPQDLTAAEVARQMGYTELLRILAPVILHPLPSRLLEILQVELHKLIKEIINDDEFVSYLRLPELTVLTEFEEPIMWFPVYRKGSPEWTFKYFLDERQLLVNVNRLSNAAQEQNFRISDSGCVAIEEPLANRAGGKPLAYKDVKR